MRIPGAFARRIAALVALAAAGCHGEDQPVRPGFRVVGGWLSVTEGGGTATFQVALATAPREPVDVDVLSEDATEGLLSAPAGGAPGAWIRLRFTPSSWDVFQAVTVTGVDDALRDGDVAWRVALLAGGSSDAAYAAAPDASVRVVTRDDDTPAIRLSRTALFTAETGAVTDGFEVVLASEPSSPVTVPVWSTDESEGRVSGGLYPIAPSGSTHLTFTPTSWSMPQAVTVTSLDDDEADGGQVYTVRVGPATGAPEYVGLPPQDVTVVNADTDVVDLVVSWHGETSFLEGTLTSFSVRLASRPAGSVSVPIVSGNVAEADLSLGAALPTGAGAVALAFDASSWSTPQAVFIHGRPDFTTDGPQTFPVTFGPSTGDPAYAALPARSFDITVLDQDLPAEVLVSTVGLPVREGSSGAVAIRLSTVPSEPVFVRVATGDRAQAYLETYQWFWTETSDDTSVTLRFDAANWSSDHWVYVHGTLDGIADGSRVVPITFGPPTGDARYAALPATTLEVTVLEGDPIFIGAWSTTALGRLPEGGSVIVGVWLPTAPLADVVVPVSTSDAAEALVSAGGSPPSQSLTLTFTPASWSEQLVTVLGTDDATLELGAPHPFRVAIGPARSTGPYDGAGGSTGFDGAIEDDEVAASEGTLADPVEIGGLLPWAGQVGKGSSSYRVSGFPDGGVVRVEAVPDPVSFTVLEDGPEPATLCPASTPSLDSACAVRLPPGGSFIVQVDGSTTARGASLVIDAAPFTFGPDVPRAIPDAADPGATSELALAGVPPDCSAIALFLEIAHPRAADLLVWLRPPGAASSPVMQCQNVEGADFDRTVLFAGTGLTYVCAAGPPYAGVFWGNVPLGDPAAVNGTWTLEVRDTTAGNEGTVVRWGLAAR